MEPSACTFFYAPFGSALVNPAPARPRLAPSGFEPQACALRWPEHGPFIPTSITKDRYSQGDEVGQVYGFQRTVSQCPPTFKTIHATASASYRTTTPYSANSRTKVLRRSKPGIVNAFLYA